MVKCPECGSEYTYEDRGMTICSMCAFEWDPNAAAQDAPVYRDFAGNILVEGDDVALVKDLSIGSSSKVIKRGTKGRSIQLGEYRDNHDISCKVDGFGNLLLKTTVVKKVAKGE